jgi:iron complex outermembrane receptor protein
MPRPHTGVPLSESNSPSERQTATDKPIERALHRNRHRQHYVLTAAAIPFLVSAAHAQSDPAITLPTVQVEGTTPSNPDMDGYVAKRTTSATKTNAPWVSTPQSVSTVGAEQIRDQKPATFDQIFRYSPGVKGESFGQDTRNDWFLLRGFSSQNEAMFLDGLQLFTTSFATWKLYPFALDRVDILRGPSAALYGGGSPGGVINAISKTPPVDPLHYVEVGVNNYGNRYFSFDLGGPLAVPAEYGKVYYRLTGMTQGGDTQVDFTKDDAYFINPALTWKPNPNTTLTILASVSQNKTNGQNFLPYVGTVTPAPFGKISPNLFTSDPSMDEFRRNQQMIGYQFEQALSNSLTFRQNARFAHVDVLETTLYGVGYATTPAAADLARFNFVSRTSADQINLDNQLEYKFATGPLSHTALVGLDLKYYSINDFDAFAAGPSLNLLNPIYTATQPTTAAPYQNALLTQKDGGLYTQDQINFARWTLLLSGRYDEVATDNDNRIGADQSRSDGKFSGRAGLSYLTDIGIAPYVSYSTSFNPVIGTNYTTGQLLAPETGNQTEVGVKYEPSGFNGHFSAAWFDLRRQNVPTTDPANAMLSTQTGEVRSSGIELEAVLNPAPGLKLTGTYTSYDLEVTQDLDPANIGKELPGVPEQFASAWADYTFQSGPLQGFGFGGGARYVGKSYADEANTMPVDAYTLFDAAVHYETKGWRAAINVTNIAGTTYVASCSSPTACFYGDGTRMTASLGYTW